MEGSINNYLNELKITIENSLQFEKYKKMLTLVIIENITILTTLLFMSILWIISFLTLFKEILEKINPTEIIDPIQLFLTNPLPTIILTIIIFVSIIIFGLISLYFNVSKLRMGESLIEGKIIRAKEALKRGKNGYFSTVKTTLVWEIIWTLFIGVLIFPILLIISDLIIKGKISISDPTTLIWIVPLILLIIFITIIIVITNFIISPFTNLIIPIALFENKGVIYSIKESCKRAKINYFEKLLFITITGIIIAIIVLINEFIQRKLGELIGPYATSILLLGGGINVIGILILTIILFISIIIAILISALAGLIQNVLIAKLYQISLKETKKQTNKIKNHRKSKKVN